MQFNYPELLAKLETEIRKGNIALVRQNLEGLNQLQIPREFLVEIANLARRVRLETWGLKILRPVTRPKAPIQPAASDEEWAIYAALLLKIGATPEALKILEQISATTSSANVILYQAYAYISEWAYEKAIPLLKKYCNFKNITDYQRCIAQVNLASSLIYCEYYAEAGALLSSLRKICEQQKWDLLLGNCLEISAQLFIQQSFWQEAENFLTQAEKHASQHQQYFLFIEKWRKISLLMQNPRSEKNLTGLEELRQKAASQKNWETLRDCDFYQGLYTEHLNLLAHVYYGTPYPSYKKRVEKKFKKNGWEIPDSYIWKISNSPTDRCFDIQIATELNEYNTTSSLKPGQMIHRLLSKMTSDFYRSFFLGQIFSEVFINEYFNPESSAERVAQAVKMTRKWFSENQIPLEIQVQDGEYKLIALGPYSFKIHRLNVSQSLKISHDVALLKLKEHWQHKSFSSSQAAQFLGMSASSVRPLLKDALDKGLLFTSGAGRSLLYRFEK